MLNIYRFFWPSLELSDVPSQQRQQVVHRMLGASVVMGLAVAFGGGLWELLRGLTLKQIVLGVNVLVDSSIAQGVPYALILVLWAALARIAIAGGIQYECAKNIQQLLDGETIQALREVKQKRFTLFACTYSVLLFANIGTLILSLEAVIDLLLFQVVVAAILFPVTEFKRGYTAQDLENDERLKSKLDSGEAQTKPNSRARSR